MNEVAISEVPVTSSAALSLYHAAVDELMRRYGTDDGLRVNFEELTPPRGFFLVARAEGHLAAGVGVRTISDPDLHVGEVKRLWVRPDLRRRGVAARLMSALEDHARTRGYRRLYLETGVEQPEALAFYRRHGWAEVDEFPSGAFSYPKATRFTKPL